MILCEFFLQKKNLRKETERCVYEKSPRRQSDGYLQCMMGRIDTSFGKLIPNDACWNKISLWFSCKMCFCRYVLQPQSQCEVPMQMGAAAATLNWMLLITMQDAAWLSYWHDDIDLVNTVGKYR